MDKKCPDCLENEVLCICRDSSPAEIYRRKLLNLGFGIENHTDKYDHTIRVSEAKDNDLVFVGDHYEYKCHIHRDHLHEKHPCQCMNKKFTKKEIAQGWEVIQKLNDSTKDNEDPA